MFTIIGLMLTGMLLGYLLRKRNLHRIHTVITVLIWALLFILGIEVGGNEQIIKGLHTIGIEAVILTLGGTLGGCFSALLHSSSRSSVRSAQKRLGQWVMRPRSLWRAWISSVL